jgi:hypothetical protein
MIKTIKDTIGVPFFTSIELMKLSESARCVLLLMTKDKQESTKQVLDTFFEIMAAEGYHKSMASDHKCITQTNFIALNHFSKSFSGYSSKFTLDPNNTNTSTT